MWRDSLVAATVRKVQAFPFLEGTDSKTIHVSKDRDKDLPKPLNCTIESCEKTDVAYAEEPVKTVITDSQILIINKDDIYSSRDARVPSVIALVYKNVNYEVATCTIIDAEEKTVDFSWEKGSKNVLCFAKGMLKDPTIKFPLKITLTKK